MSGLRLLAESLARLRFLAVAVLRGSRPSARWRGPDCSYSVILAPAVRFRSDWEGVVPAAGPEVWACGCVASGCGVSDARLAFRATLSLWRRMMSSCFLVSLISASPFRLGAAGQLSCPAGKGPWQLAHRGFSVQLTPEGPGCWSFRVPQLLQRAYLTHLAGLQKLWHPGSCLEMAGFLLISFARSLVLKRRNGRTGARNEMIQVIFPVRAFAPNRDGRQLTGWTLVCATTSSSMMPGRVDRGVAHLSASAE